MYIFDHRSLKKPEIFSAKTDAYSLITCLRHCNAQFNQGINSMVIAKFALGSGLKLRPGVNFEMIKSNK